MYPHLIPIDVVAADGGANAHARLCALRDTIIPVWDKELITVYDRFRAITAIQQPLNNAASGTYVSTLTKDPLAGYYLMFVGFVSLFSGVSTSLAFLFHSSRRIQ